MRWWFYARRKAILRQQVLTKQSEVDNGEK